MGHRSMTRGTPRSIVGAFGRHIAKFGLAPASFFLNHDAAQDVAARPFDVVAARCPEGAAVAWKPAGSLWACAGGSALGGSVEVVASDPTSQGGLPEHMAGRLHLIGGRGSRMSSGLCFRPHLVDLRIFCRVGHGCFSCYLTRCPFLQEQLSLVAPPLGRCACRPQGQVLQPPHPCHDCARGRSIRTTHFQRAVADSFSQICPKPFPHEREDCAGAWCLRILRRLDADTRRTTA